MMGRLRLTAGQGPSDAAAAAASQQSSVLPPNNDQMRLPMGYTVVEILVAISAFFGNLLAILVFIQDRRLRKVTNFYIVSLSAADLLVGLVGVPSAILTRIGLPRNAFTGCLTMLSLLVVLCTISILNLVAVSLDRFWAILYPLNYHSRMSSRAARIIIITCWIIGALVGFLPLFGWNKGPHHSNDCFFISIMDYDFLVFLFFATIVFPALIMLFAYLRIYLVVVHQSTLFEKNQSKSSKSSKHESHEVIKLPSLSDSSLTNDSTSDSCDHRKMLSYNRREVKKARKLAIIVAFFMLCWIPLYLNNTLEAFFDLRQPYWLVDTFIVLSHLNSAVNPLLYAYHMKDFREAMKTLLCRCIIRPNGLRDLRRQELITVSGKHINRRYGDISWEYSTNTVNNSPEHNPRNPRF